MKILFIQPNLGNYRAKDAMEPLVWSYLKALTPTDIQIEFWDDRIEEIPLDLEAEAVAMSVETYTAQRAYGIAASFRQRGIPVIMGGFHATAVPDEVALHADAVVTGDAEDLWPCVVDDLRSGSLQPFYRMSTLPNITDGRTDRSVYGSKEYPLLSLVQYTRGCAHACNFCSIRANYGDSLRFRSVSRVVDDIRASGKKHIFFVDDNILGDRQHFKELLEAIIPLKIRWSCQISLDVTDDDELLDLMQRSGCFNMLVGFESLNKDNMSQMGKRWNLRQGPYADQIKKIYDHGMLIYATFIFGYDQDGPEVFEETVDFALDSGFFLTNFNPLTPMPGTVLYDKLKQEGRLLYDSWWTDPNYRYGQAAFVPANMTPEQLTQGCLDARKRFNHYPNVLKRLNKNWVNHQSWYHTRYFLMANLISRGEISNKQGLKLG